MTPTEFMTEYVRPSIALWEAEPTSTLRAVCALSQLDIFAEVVALHQAGGTLPKGGARPFRDDVGKREPAIARVRDAHYSHKHGRLSRSTAEHTTEGQRPYQSAGTAFFAGHNYAGDFVGQPDTSLRMDAGMPVPVGQMIREGMEARERELARLGLSI